MTIQLKGDALEYYILSSLSTQDLYGAQILQNLASYISINDSDLYETLTKLENEGMITKEYVQEDTFTHYNLCSITPQGRDYIKTLMETLDRRLVSFK